MLRNIGGEDVADDIVLEFNQEDLDEYIEYYFKIKPRCIKVPIEAPMVRSLNKMLVITNRIVQNNHKQNYKDYAIYIVKKYGYKDLGISECNMEVELVFPTKTHRDIDNFVMKEVMDGFTSSGLLNEDDYDTVKSIKTTARYEKGVTKMIFTFKDCKFDLEELAMNKEKERIKREKRDIAMNKKKSKKKMK